MNHCSTSANDPKHASLADPDCFTWRGVCVESQVWLPGIGLRQPASAGYYSPGIIPDACPSKTNLLSETFSARASAPKPASLVAFRPALGSRSGVSLL